MVRFSDPVTGFKFDPLNVRDYKQVAGMIIALGVVFFGINVAQNEVTPRIGQLVNGVTGGLIGGSQDNSMITFGGNN